MTDATKSSAAPATLVSIPSSRGEIAAMWHAVPGAASGLLMVGGFDGGFDGPAEAIFPTLAADFAERGVASLRLDFRLHTSPGNVEECTHDALAGLAWLEAQGVRRVALIGHSFGAAVVITAGAQHPSVVTVVTLAAQTFGTRPVNRISPRPLLLVHGGADDRLPPACSEYLYARALEPKRLVILEGATHSLRQRRAELRTLLTDWLAVTLGAKARAE
ncbi:MAG: alpha/beta hydrolase [Chloroflexi bacterium]|nr:alpha/beta hydrolase [Chloroflexota bacterium]